MRSLNSVPIVARWFGLLVALAATIATTMSEPASDDELAATERRQSTESSTSLATPAPAPFAGNSDSDPFAVKAWSAHPAAPPAPAIETPSPVATVTPSSPPVEPPLPFRYLGRFSGEAGSVTYLGRGDQTLLVKQGDILEGGYKVLELGPRKIEFEYLATGGHQAIPIPEAE